MNLDKFSGKFEPPEDPTEIAYFAALEKLERYISRNLSTIEILALKGYLEYGKIQRDKAVEIVALHILDDLSEDKTAMEIDAMYPQLVEELCAKLTVLKTHGNKEAADA